MLHKKNKFGFTLIELMAIVIIVGTIAVLSYIALNNTIKRNKYNQLKTFENNIIVATKLYLTSNSEKYSELENIGGRVNIPTKDLIDTGYLKTTVKNPTNISIDKYYVIVSINENSFYDYSVVSDENKINENLTYKDSTLNGATPILTSNMIPIKYNDSGQTIKASMYEEWYNYTNKQWANVVILKKSTKDKYNNKSAGTVIEPSDIQAYFVWIPRYKYKIFNSATDYNDTKQQVEIIFENNKSIKSNGTKIGEYLTPPGFKFGNLELNGIWFGKFETSNTDLLPTIIPNINADIRNQFVKFWKASTKFNELMMTGDAHISKLSEYATLIYLSSSKYASNSIKGNYNEDFITGCGSTSNQKTDDCVNKFGISNSEYTQSTTGNQYGVFDAAGGAWEHTMSFKSTDNKTPYVGLDKNINTGFEGILLSNEKIDGMKLPDNKYYDTIPSLSWSKLCNNSKYYGYSICETPLWEGSLFSYEGDNGGIIFLLGGSAYDNPSIYSVWPGMGSSYNESDRMVLTVN